MERQRERRKNPILEKASRGRLGKLKEWWTGPRVAALLLGLIGIAIGIAGYINQYCETEYCNSWRNPGEIWGRLFKDFYANVSSSLVFITITVFVIDWLGERRDEQLLKAGLIRNMRSRDNGIALQALEELAEKNWLFDGSLKNKSFRFANLDGVWLVGAELQSVIMFQAIVTNVVVHNTNLRSSNLAKAILGGSFSKVDMREAQLSGTIMSEAKMEDVDFRGANFGPIYSKRVVAPSSQWKEMFGEATLCGAVFKGCDLRDAVRLTEKQLVSLKSLAGTLLPDGKRYDGRYNLEGDIAEVVEIFGQPISQQKLANFYGVPVEVYLTGQEWARENLAKLRREAGLEPEMPVETDTSQRPTRVATAWCAYGIRRLREKFFPSR